MKISYNNLKRYKKDLKSPEELAGDLIMHAAEVEEIHSEWKRFNHIVYWKIKDIEKHPDADSLKICKVDIWESENLQIVCWWSNLELEQAVAVAKLWASVFWHGEPEPVIMKKIKIRWIESFWMICASDEIWLKDEFPANDSKEILDFWNLNAKTWTNLADLLRKNDFILDVDNKAINHRPDLFSHIGILREIYAINWEKFDFDYEDKDFSSLPSLWIKNEIPEIVARYIWLKINWVKNLETPDYIKEVLEASNCASKWLLIDLSNYSLYLYGQPTHIFDADKVVWSIVIRFAKNWEKILALDEKEYELSEKDIVVADRENILAIAWIIWGKNSAVSENTKNIIIEAANFDHATLRLSWKRLWIRTDALNIFEKDLLPVSARWGLSLIVHELEKCFTDIDFESYSDCLTKKIEEKTVDYDLNFINNLIWKIYSEKIILKILGNLNIKKKADKLIIPAWRKELNYKSDIAEEIARIDGYDNVKSQVPKIQLWAVIQNNIYKAKTFSRNFFVSEGFYDMYTYSFVNEKLMKKCNSNLSWLVPLKNSLSEDATHMKNSLIPNLLLSLEKNKVDFKELNLFEVEKVFSYNEETNNITESYNLSWIITSNKNIAYYDMQNIVSKFLKEIWVSKYNFKKDDKTPSYAHVTRTAQIVARGQKIGVIWEIKPIVMKNFNLKSKLWFFEINLDKLSTIINSIIKTNNLSEFQSSNFDISFLIDKNLEWSRLQNIIEKTNPKIIEKVELFDIYENEEKLPGKRSISFKIFLQKMESEINDKEKNELISEILKKAEKFWAEHR